MSTVKLNNLQVGQSGTATQNFTVYQPSTPDGTVRIGVGNAGATSADVLTVANSGNVGIGTSSPGAKLSVSDGTVTLVTSPFAAGSTGYFGTSTNHPLALLTNNTERARIDSSGNLLVGTTGIDSTNGTGVTLQKYGGGAYITIAHTTGASSGDGFMSFYRGATGIGSITQNGTTAVAYNTTSDYRLKQNVQPLSGALEKVVALKPSEFEWVDGRADDGFIAHELQAVLPNVVTGDKDAVNEDGTPRYQQVDYARIVPTLTAAIQELNAKVDAQAAEIAALKGANNDA